MTAKGLPAQRTLRDGRYVLLRQLGAGAQGTTWEAVDKREGRTVAIKRFDVRGARSWKDVELAEREARVLSALSHPKLPRYVEHFEDDGALYLVMEKIEGTPLSVLCRQGPADPVQVLRLLKDADDVLTYLHGRVPVVVHRDLKPSNVIRRPDGSYAFVDFGAVRDRLRPDGGSTVVGTFGYMAPEQLQGRAGPGTDVYALGATALAYLTGREPETLPHRGLSIDVDAVVLSRRNRWLRDALKAMLEPDPDRRPTRVGPLLRGAPGKDGGRNHSDESVAEAFERAAHGVAEASVAEAFERAARRRDRRHARRAERRARRVEERESRRAPRSAGGATWALPLVVNAALGIVQVVLAVTLRVAVPLLLFLLSLVFGRGLQRAARAVSRAGERAVDAIGGARSRVHRPEGATQGTLRVSPGVRTKARVVVDDEDAPAADEEAIGESEPGRRRGGRGSSPPAS